MCQIQQQKVEAVGHNSIERVWKEMIVCCLVFGFDESAVSKLVIVIREVWAGVSGCSQQAK